MRNILQVRILRIDNAQIPVKVLSSDACINSILTKYTCQYVFITNALLISQGPIGQEHIGIFSASVIALA